MFNPKAFLVGLALTILLVPALPARAMPGQAEDKDPARISFYTVGPYSDLPVAAVDSRTLIKHGLSITHITYLVKNRYPERSEVGVNLHLPTAAVLTGFGYCYKRRFIKGKMFDTNEAWKVYTAVTSRGRDPGIMDRPTDRDYHAQVYPVEARHNLKVVLEISAALTHDGDRVHCEVPLSDASAHVHMHSTMTCAGMSGRPTSNIDGMVRRANGTVLALDTNVDGPSSWDVSFPTKRATEPCVASTFSARSGRDDGYYAVYVDTANKPAGPVSVSGGVPGSVQTKVVDNGVYVFGRYRQSGDLTLKAEPSEGNAAYSLTTHLSSGWVDEGSNVAAKLWADREIASMQGSGNPSNRAQVVSMSQRYLVVSNYTALLAIPNEVMSYYKKVLAKQQVQTNTQQIGGGGGDPYISVKAPADASRVVAVLPDARIVDLQFDPSKQAWTGRFDLPLDAPAGPFRVTVIVVHRDGKLSRFDLSYDNRQSGTTAKDAGALTSTPGGQVPVRIEGDDIARAVAIAPWGERVDLKSTDDAWTGTLTVPSDWPSGASHIQVILLDGAHNRTEVDLDLTVD